MGWPLLDIDSILPTGNPQLQDIGSLPDPVDPVAWLRLPSQKKSLVLLTPLRPSPLPVPRKQIVTAHRKPVILPNVGEIRVRSAGNTVTLPRGESSEDLVEPCTPVLPGSNDILHYSIQESFGNIANLAIRLTEERDNVVSDCHCSLHPLFDHSSFGVLIFTLSCPSMIITARCRPTVCSITKTSRTGALRTNFIESPKGAQARICCSTTINTLSNS